MNGAIYNFFLCFSLVASSDWTGQQKVSRFLSPFGHERQFYIVETFPVFARYKEHVHAVALVDAQHLMTTQRAEMDGDITGLLAAKEYREAFDLLLPRYKDRVFRLCISIMRNETQAEDVAQEVFLRIWKALPGFQGQASLSTWIYAITRNRCFTEFRKACNRPTLSIHEPETEALLHQFAAPAAESQSGREMDIDWMLSQLPEKYARAISLFYLEQRSYEEVAAMLGVPLGTVKTFLYRGKRELLRIAGRNPVVSARQHEVKHETCNR